MRNVFVYCDCCSSWVLFVPSVDAPEVGTAHPHIDSGSRRKCKESGRPFDLGKLPGYLVAPSSDFSWIVMESAAIVPEEFEYQTAASLRSLTAPTGPGTYFDNIVLPEIPPAPPRD